MEKINVEEIDFVEYVPEGSLERIQKNTIKSLKILANKINEIIDVVNKKDQFDLKNAEWMSDLLEFMYKSKKEDSNPICKKCVYQRVVICDKCSDESIAGEDIDDGKAVFKSKIDGKIYMVKEDWEKEFDKEFKNGIKNPFFSGMLYIEKEKVKQFIRNLLK